MKTHQKLLTILALTCLPHIALASINFYTDSTSWSANVVGLQTDSFNQYSWASNGTYLGTTTTLGGNTYSVPFDGGPYGIANASKMFGYGANSSQLTGQLEWQDYYGLIEPLTITLASSTYAIKIVFA